MAVDGFTLVAQVVNFLVLVWLLRRLFYRRIIGAMDKREAGIARRLDETTRERAEAERQAALYVERNREFEQQREQMLARAGEEAEARRAQLLEDASAQAGKAQAQWLQTLQREREGLLQEFRQRVGQGVFRLAGQGLRELADSGLEAQVLKVFVQRVELLGPQQREAIAAAIRDSGGEVEVRTAFALDAAARGHLADELRRLLDAGVQPRFSTVPELICGIELRARSHRLAWNLDAYLEGLEASVFDVLDEGVRGHAADR